MLGLTGAALAGLPAAAINSTPPSGPGNIEVFPQRDMIAVEGYAEQAGKKATITVLRGGQAVGSAAGTLDASGFLEVNHPGGVCWGTGTTLQVTPDLRAGDEIRVDFADGTWDGSTVVDVEATGVVLDEVNHTLTINGRYGPGVDMPGADLVADPGRFGIEIVNPDMRNGSAIGERAIGWPTDAAPTGHTVEGTVTGSDEAGGTFSVRYGFQNGDDLALANAGAVTALGWLAEPDPALGVEAQFGLTLNEFYEHGGPGMGGCPAGPEQTRTNGPATYSARGAGDGSIRADWQAAAPIPGAPPVTGYTVRAVTLDGVDEVGKRLPADARSATISGLAAGDVYSVEITARSDAGEGAPSVISRVRAQTHVVPTATATTLRRPNADGKYAPLVTNANGDFGVHLDPAPGVMGAEIHYTTDGSAPSLTSRTFTPGDPSLQITQDTTLRWIVVDSGKVVGPQGSQFFDIVEAAHAAPEITSVVVPDVSGALDVVIGRLADPSVVSYRVQAYTGDSADVATGVRVGTPYVVAQPTDAAVAEVVRRVPGLTNGSGYRFSVAARYGTAWSAESALSGVATPAPASSANAGADQTVLRGRTVTLDGTASSKAISYQWVQVRPAAVAPATYRDPVVTITGADTAKPTVRFPTKTSAASDDGTYEFRVVTTHQAADGSTFTRGDNVVIKEQRDAVAATRTRWRAGDTLVGTGTQSGARLSFHSGSHTGPVVATATVANGQWTVPGTNAQPTGGKFYVWSDYGYVGEITVTP
ncbi:fibronectin type III domain-containing protein [uncultured Cellulomonas sp.]|uniref:fibronectin type III domain-containing protein n=1 Tax=uncultured Cellulomonas sp. TaxID=189682 RepID=UPI002612352D|nr:fibronectin type III domain-containing protein [uncultured Cellulomonas sp.]